jgi:hypothetical protein
MRRNDGEKHLECMWIPKNECAKDDLLPAPMRKKANQISAIAPSFWGSDF